MNRIATRSMTLLILVMLLLGGFGFFLVEYFVESENWVIHSGSPHVYNVNEVQNEQVENLGCGVIVDRDLNLILDMHDTWTYAESALLRQSMVHWVGDRLGNISAPAMSHYAADLAGFDRVNGLYNYGQKGGLAELTLSGALQTVALEALGDYKGTVAVFNYKTGELLCAVTTPTYDPDNIPQFEEGDPLYDGLYFNRFTQSAYIPGSVFKIVTMAAALEENPTIVEQTFSCTGIYKIGNEEITCEDAHGTQSLKDAFRNSCNCAFAQIAQQLGGDKLQQYVEKFGVIQAVSFDGITTAKGNFKAADEAELNVAWSGIGQYLDLMNPCAFLTFVGAVANDGKVVTPHLIGQISVGNNVTYKAKTNVGEQIMSENTARILQDYMKNNVAGKYGVENFPGLTVGAKTGTGEVDGQKPNATLAGFVEDENLPLAFMICVEDAGYGRAVCIPIISKVLETARTLL